jgi:tetratricopeptide (TPR) repeat protein
LGFALATVEKLADAMKNFAKAEELGCIPENLVQLYNILGIICFDIGRYDDALVNLGKSEQVIGPNLEILQRKAIIYGMQDDFRNGLLTANQIKLIAPTEYLGYQLAFKLLVQAKRLDDAAKELARAERFSSPTMDYFFDAMTLELEKYRQDDDKRHFDAALTIIEKALKAVKPTLTEVFESYINAAEIYLQLERPDQTLGCLNAAQNPAGAYNAGFELIPKDYSPVTLTQYDVDDMAEADSQRIAEEYGEYGLEELAENTPADEEGNREYFTEIPDAPQEAESDFKLDEAENAEYSAENTDHINRLYIGAYTLKKDFEKVIEYARVLQASESVQNSYIGQYTEANALKELGSPDAAQKYEEIIKFFRNAMIKDPTDLAAVTFRVQCYIDIGNFDEAEQVCALLTGELREPLLEKISKAKSGGD